MDVTSTTRRFAVIAIVAGAMLSACATDAESIRPDPPAPSRSAVAGADCLVQGPGFSDVDGTLEQVYQYTVTPLCAADVNPAFAEPDFAAQFSDTVAGTITQGGEPVLTVFAGELKSGDAFAFADEFLADVNAQVAQSNPPSAVAVEWQDLAANPVKYFNGPPGLRGYVLPEGPRVVIGYVAAGAAAPAAREAFTDVLINLPRRDYGRAGVPLGQGRFASPDDPHWVYFRKRNGFSCGIGPDGSAGCDVAPREAPEGSDQTVVAPGEAARYHQSDGASFVRDVDELPEGFRLENGGTSCQVGYQGTVSCETADGAHGFTVSTAYGVLS